MHAPEFSRLQRYTVPAAITLLHGIAMLALVRNMLPVTPPAEPGAGVVVTVLAESPPLAPHPQAEPPKPQPRPPAQQAVQRQRAETPVAVVRPADVPAADDPAAAEPPAAAPTAHSQATLREDAAPALTPPRFDAAYLDNRAPDYPPLSRRLGEQGRVVLRVWVDTDGAAREVQLHASSGYPRLDEAAVAAVKRWRFVPARRGDMPVAEWVRVPIPFVLR